ncbi:MAG: hypothetical protein ACRDPG_03345 [Nocardioidaceae bacterium]
MPSSQTPVEDQMVEVTPAYIPPPTRPRLEISGVKVVGGALAAVSAAVAASWLGVAGTVIGAAVGSVVATVGTALYSHSLERSRKVLLETIPVRPPRPRGAPAREVTRVVPAVSEPETMVVHSAQTQQPTRPIPWRAVAATTAVTLVVGLGVLTAAELITGRTAAAWTGSDAHGGTTVGELLRQSSGSPAKAPQHQQPVKSLPTVGHPTTGTPPTTTSPTSSNPTTTSPTSSNPTTTSPTTSSPTTTQPSQTSPTGAAPTAPQTPAVDGATATG